MFWQVIIFATLLVFIEFSGDYVLTHMSQWSTSKRLSIAVLIYFILGLSWCVMVIHRDSLNVSLAMLNLLWQTGSILSITSLSYFILKEHVSVIGWISQIIILLGFSIALVDLSI